MIDLTTYKYLFLDRDGVINAELKDDYVKSVSEFIFIEGALEAIARLSKLFNRIFIVTNQRGIGRGKMSLADLEKIHFFMLSQIEKQGGRIDQIYFCADIKYNSSNRKPNIGMGLQAKVDFPEIEFDQSIMVGNSRSDIEFGNNLGMLTILVGDKYKNDDNIYNETDHHFENLFKFVSQITDL